MFLCSHFGPSRTFRLLRAAFEPVPLLGIFVRCSVWPAYVICQRSTGCRFNGCAELFARCLRHPIHRRKRWNSSSSWPLSSKDLVFDTYDEYWLATCWSLEAMYEGKWPFKDHKGAGGRMEQGGHRRVLVWADFPADLACSTVQITPAGEVVKPAWAAPFSKYSAMTKPSEPSPALPGTMFYNTESHLWQMS